ncbi:MAG: hypothetical protein WD080_07010, partial [Egibacteraceae bacterium]
MSADVVDDRSQTRPLATAAAERGSIPLGLLVIIVISGLVSVMLATTVSAQRQARHDSDFTTVLYAADAAVEQAQFRLRASTSAEARMPVEGSTLTGVQESCPLLGVSWCIAGGSAETGRYQWYAQRLGHTRSWEVTAVGERNGVQRRLRVIVEEGRRFFAAAFADSIANFGNNNVADSYDSGRGDRPERWPGPGRAGWVGSNGPVETGGSSSVLDGLQMFNLAAAGTSDPASQCSGQGRIGLDTEQSVCSTWAQTNPVGSVEGPYLQGSAQPRTIAPGPPELRTALNACGSGPYPALVIDSAGVHVTAGTTPVTVRTVAALQPFRMEPATLPTGQPNPFVGVGLGAAPEEANYYCFRSVRISVDTTIVAPQTATHLTGTDIPTTTEEWTPRADMANPDDAVTLYVTGNVEIETTRRLNCVACNRPFPTDPGAFPPPRSGALQVFLQRRLDSDPPAAFHVGNDARFGGAIHAPGANCGGSGSLSTAGTAADIYGAMVCDSIDGVGQWHFHYDESLEFIGNTDFGTQ